MASKIINIVFQSENFDSYSNFPPFEQVLAMAYNDVINNDDTIPIVIDLSGTLNWISSHSLSQVALFTAWLRAFRQNPITIRLLPQEYDELAKRTVTLLKLTSADHARIYERIVMYERFAIRSSLAGLRIRYLPDESTYLGIAKQFGVRFEQEWGPFSANILPIKKLRNTQSSNQELADRIEGLANVFYHRCFHEKGITDAKKVLSEREESRQIAALLLYEIAQNIYQHAGLGWFSEEIPMGFASAQIVDFIDKVARNQLLDARIIGIPDSLMKKRLRYLAITMVDFGVGLARKIEGMAQERKIVQEALSLSAVDNAVTKAVATSYSTKKDKICQDQFELLRGNVPLALTGEGFLRCLKLIWEHFGSMEVITENVRIVFSASEKSRIQRSIDDGTVPLIEIDDIKSTSAELFEKKISRICSERAPQPGTAIRIILPIDLQSAEREDQWQEEKKNHLLKSYHNLRDN